VPKRLIRRMPLRVVAGGASSVVSSNLGAVNPAASVLAYQPGRHDSNDALQQAISNARTDISSADERAVRISPRWPTPHGATRMRRIPLTSRVSAMRKTAENVAFAGYRVQARHSCKRRRTLDCSK